MIVEEVMESSEEASKIFFKWFSDDLIESNADKCHLLVSTRNKVIISRDNFDISNSKSESLLGNTFDNNLTFDYHISELSKKDNQKPLAQTRVTLYMNTSKKRILMKAFFTSKFSYYPLIWMCCSYANHRKVYSLHERCL